MLTLWWHKKESQEIKKCWLCSSGIMNIWTKCPRYPQKLVGKRLWLICRKLLLFFYWHPYEIWVLWDSPSQKPTLYTWAEIIKGRLHEQTWPEQSCMTKGELPKAAFGLYNYKSRDQIWPHLTSDNTWRDKDEDHPFYFMFLVKPVRWMPLLTAVKKV